MGSVSSTREAKLAQLIQGLAQDGFVHTQRIADVMQIVDRAQFVTQSTQQAAYNDRALPIEHNVVISAPHLHAYVMESLETKLRPGAKVLDIGCGSGYLCATFYELCKNRSNGMAQIYGIEHVEELCEFSRVNLRKSYSQQLNDGSI